VPTNFARFPTLVLIVFFVVYNRILPSYIQVWKGKDIVKTSRAMLGSTNPANCAPGTIRGDLAIDTGRNVCHGSDSVESAEREIALWFPEGLRDYNSHSDDWTIE